MSIKTPFVSLLACLTLLTSMLVPPATAAVPPDTTLRLSLSSTTGLGLHPHTESVVAHNAYEGLVRYNPRDPQGGVLPGTASSWNISDDGKTYTFHLRDAFWSDGSPVKAQDFVYGWHQWNPHLPLPQISMFDINTATALDEKTLQVTFVRQGDDLIREVASDYLQPIQQTFAEAKGELFGSTAATSLFNGPFVARDVEKGTVVLEKNLKYWDAANVKIEKVVLYNALDDSTSARMLSNGELDQAEFAQTYGRFFDMSLLHSLNNSTGNYLELNAQSGPTANVHIRRALLLSAPLSSGLHGFIPYSIAGAKGEYRTSNPIPLAEDLTKAKQELQQGLAELHLSELPPLTLISEESSSYLNAVAAWEQGLGANIQVQTTTSFEDKLQQISKGNFSIATMNWGPDFNDPMTFLGLYHSGYGYYQNVWHDPSYDALLDDINATHNNPTLREQKIRTAEQAVLDNAVIIPLKNFRPYEQLIQPYVDLGITVWNRLPNFAFATKTTRPMLHVSDFHDAADIPDYARPSIEKMMNADVLKGSGGLYDPNGQVTREQFVKMIVKGMGISTTTSPVKFQDVDSDSWSYDYIYAAASSNIVHGSQNAGGAWLFKPTDPVTRAEIATMIVHVLKLPASGTGGTFPDVANHWGKVAIQTAKANGLFNGYEDGSFRPDNNATRAEAAKIIDNTLSKLAWPHVYDVHQ
ncbi:S-layer homology domain-containing protein [Tumebacillus sp. ITR2]|uniref:S-layer homology domain-containing protein n=1 Tax=Tumebacillus amylolyticus TaxID=2801339 RepID=A0ABS1JA82_9BACL|nr:ABC transporter substrate-binding protein [Tumebacillus amylolyticus]MBL0387182.1 S-layer homology domain-containing protein [Tumebacillus amylolyticus]